MNTLLQCPTGMCVCGQGNSLVACRLLFFFQISELHGSHTCMRFHEFSEKGRIGKVEMVGNFFHAFVRMCQLVLDLFDGMFVDNG